MGESSMILLIFFSANGFLSNCSLNLCDRLGSGNAFHDINVTKSLPDKSGPAMGILWVLHRMVHWRVALLSVQEWQRQL